MEAAAEMQNLLQAAPPEALISHSAERQSGVRERICARSDLQRREGRTHAFRSGAHGKGVEEKEKEEGQHGAAAWRKDAVKPRGACGARVVSAHRRAAPHALKCRLCPCLDSELVRFFLFLFLWTNPARWSFGLKSAQLPLCKILKDISRYLFNPQAV